ncbi:MAG: type II toxin-antitoxin system RelE/ParE family toxin [Chlamydiia bacterium]|nr:type II toxin-antitoxin system RelE/ParE family toxin [Chlamydiia bacterium]
MRYTILGADEYFDWFESEPARSRVQIAKRLDRIQDEGHFGDYKKLRSNLWELRWENGRRVYFSLIPEAQVLMLLGGNKNGQTKDINKAEKIYKKWIDD